MSIYRKKLYIILASATTAGYIWLLIKFLNGSFYKESAYNGCLIKQATGVPCPSCGSTRSIASLLQGHFVEALYWNPFGLIITIIMLVLPFWLIYDLVQRKDSLYVFYGKTEAFVRQKKIAIPLIILVIINWIWNIIKGL